MRSQPVWRMPVAMPIGHNLQLAWKARSCGGAMQRAMVLHLQESAAGHKVRPTVFFRLTGSLPWLRCSRHAACWCRRWTRTTTSPRTSPAWRSAVRPCWRAWSALVSLARRAVCGGLMWAAGCGSWSPPWILPMPCAPVFCPSRKKVWTTMAGLPPVKAWGGRGSSPLPRWAMMQSFHGL